MTAPGPLAVFGAAHWDLIGVPSAPAAPGEDVPGRILRRPGGVALNLALALAALGRPVALHAPVGADPDGDALAACLADRAVPLHRLGQGPTGAYLALEDGAGGLLGAVADLPAAEALGPADLPLSLASPPCLILDANLPAAVLQALADAAPSETRLVAVPASPAKARRLAAILPRLSLLIANRAEAEALAGRPLPTAETAAAALHALGASEAVVTDGPAPAAVAHVHGLSALPPARGGSSPSLEARRPRRTPRPALQATGAGDALAAAYLHRRLSGDPPETALAAGLAAAARHRSAP